MKNLMICLILLSSIFIMSCEKDDDISITTGIIGTVEYGQGDCMPSPDTIQREYSGYTGTIFFIVKEDLDSLGNGDYDNLKDNSINVNIKNGNLSAELSPDTYLVEPEDVYVYSSENSITITSEEVIHKDFKFFKCTSY